MFSKLIEELRKTGYVLIESLDGKFTVEIDNGLGCCEQLIATFKSIADKSMKHAIVIESNGTHAKIKYIHSDSEHVLFKLDSLINSTIVSFDEEQTIQMYGNGRITIFSLIYAFAALRADGTINQLIIKSI